MLAHAISFRGEGRSGTDTVSNPDLPRPKKDSMGPSGTTPTIEQLYVDFAPMVLRRARRFFDEHEAEEVVHEVFIRVIEKMDSFRGASSPSTWLYRVTTNHCLNKLRDRGRRSELLAQHHDAVPGTGTQHANQEGRAVLSQLWRTLDPELARLALYYHLDGMTHDDIGALLGCSPATVRYRLKRIAAHATKGDTA